MHRFVQTILILLVGVLSSCGIQDRLVPSVELPKQKARSDEIPHEILNYKSVLAEFATFNDIVALNFCFINQITNLSGLPGLPPMLIYNATHSLSQFQPFVTVWKHNSEFVKYAIRPYPNDSYYIDGGITSYDNNMNKIKVKYDFTGEAESAEVDSGTEYQNFDKLSKISMTIQFYDTRSALKNSIKGSIHISAIGRGYAFGFYLKGNGLGVKVAHNKRHGIGDSIDQLFGHIFTEFVRQTYSEKYGQLMKAEYSQVISLKSSQIGVCVSNYDVRKILGNRSGLFVWRQYDGSQSYANQLGHQKTFFINPYDHPINRPICFKKQYINPRATQIVLNLLKKGRVFASGNKNL
jgi:hypothetical protein